MTHQLIYKIRCKKDGNVECFYANSDEEAIEIFKEKFQGEKIKLFVLKKIIETTLYTLRKDDEVTFINKAEEVTLIDGGLPDDMEEPKKPNVDPKELIQSLTEIAEILAKQQQKIIQR